MKKFILFIFLLAILGWSCEQSHDNPDPIPDVPADIQISSGGGQVIESLNEFGFDIFKAIIADEPADKNVFISPTSISLALAMTYNGANGSTKDSMAYALRMDHLTPDQINLAYKELMAGLTSVDEKVIMEIANSIWYRLGFEVEQGFLSINQEYYNAGITELDFDSPDAPDIINAWVAEQTNDKILTILNQIEPDQVMFLINAIYFKGTWTKEFNPDNTYEGGFRLSDGSYKTTDMMSMQEEIGYMENDLLQLAELDYGRGNYSMIILLPKEELSAEDLAQELSNGNWENWLASVSTTEVKLSVPKFTFDYEKKLNDILSLMGMHIAFDPGEADFTGINSGGNLYIGFVKHKTFIEVNEEGTEAAAVTIVGMELTALEPSVVYMTVNTPFLFAIREKTTNAIVFIGKVAEPKTE